MNIFTKIKTYRNHHSNRAHYKVIGLVGLGALLFAAMQIGPVWGGGLKSAEIATLGAHEAPIVLQLKDGELKTTFTSPVFKADFKFNAIAPHWEEALGEHEHRHIDVRISSNGRSWTDWMELDVEKQLRDDVPNPGRIAPEAPLFIEGRYFQYRLDLYRSSVAQASPQIKDLRINYIDSRKPLILALTDKLKTMSSKVFASGSGAPEIISRAEWGSPDPYGNKFRGTHKYWAPTYKPVEQVFLHHTASSNAPSDPGAAVRATWEYHANTLGWGDIGYNYVLDHQGNIYEGRFGGDNVVAGHVFEYNQRSLGISVLGCFQPNSSLCAEVNNGNTTPPTTATINSLVELLSWKTTGFEIDPQATHSFCKFDGSGCLNNLPTIAAHRDAANTQCNGQLFYDMSGQIREDVATKNNTTPWAYSAKQLSYDAVGVGSNNTPVSVTLEFKNTGTATWSNSTNRLLLKTANPNNRVSSFQGDDWIDDTTPATLNEASVAPGEVGTFTFEIKHPTNTVGRFFEGLRLVSEENAEVNNIFNLVINSTIPNAVYRLYSPSVKRHFFTANTNESVSVVYNLRFRFEAMGFQACSTSDPGNSPVYRLYHAGIKKHFYTNSVRERDRVVNDLGYIYEGVAWRSCADDARPIYRLYNHHSRNHFYTRSANERNFIVNNLGFTYEGIAFWAK